MSDEQQRRVKWQALKTAAAGGTEDDLNRAAIGWAQCNGYMKASAPAPAPRQASSSGGAVLVFPPYGRSKGMPIKGASQQDLEFYANGCRRTLAAPPTPPTSKSVNSKGALKDTPANRALTVNVTPQSSFTAKAFVRDAFFHDERSALFCGDVLDRLDHLRDSNVKADCIVTSPPFYGQRDYGFDEQIGLEEHPQQYIDKLVAVFTKCWDVLSDTGSLWVNLGDTFWSGKGAAKSTEVKQSARRFGLRPQDRPGDGKWARPKQLLLIPHRFAIAMQDAGWLVRNDNVWVKPNPIPDQVRDRCSTSHEYVFHFTKARWYYFDQREVGRRVGNSVLPPLDTWVVPTARGTGVHKASFSEELVRLPILATTPPDGIVLDPFNGSGTSMLVARANGKRSIGIDLSREYCELAKGALSTKTAARITRGSSLQPARRSAMRATVRTRPSRSS